MKNLIEVEELSKSYKKTRAVDRVSWSLPEGSITGLLGSNGVGKTTTLKLLLGIVKPDNGSAQVGGYDISTQSILVRQLTAFVPEDKNLFDRMRASHFLRFYDSYGAEWDQEKAKELTEK